MKYVSQFFIAIYVAMYRLTGGIIGGQMVWGKVLLIDTVGRKTGKRRTNPVMYIRDGDNYLVAASAGGARKNPGWYHNLTANPHTTIQVMNRKFPVTAESVSPEKRPELWARFVAKQPQFKGYEFRAKRTIPLFILKP